MLADIPMLYRYYRRFGKGRACSLWLAIKAVTPL
jgi:hypothetical protein